MQGSQQFQGWAVALLIYGICGGLVQDRVAVDLIGKQGSDESFAQGSAIVDADIHIVRNVLLRPQLRSWFSIRKDVEETDRGYLLNLFQGYVEGYMELERSRRNRTFVNFVYYHYDRWRYHLAPRTSVEENLHLAILFLRDAFQRNDPPIAVHENRQVRAHTQFVTDLVIDDLMPRLMRTREISSWKWLGLIASFVFWVVSGILFFEGAALIDVVSTIGVALYASYETAGLFRRERA